MGLAFSLRTAYLLPLVVAALLVALGALWFRAAQRRRYVPFILGLVAAVLVVIGKFAWDWDMITYSGIGLLIAASVCNARPERTNRADLIELGVRRSNISTPDQEQV